ncbi:adenylate/guanylate cyclase domain-containing protein [Parasphingopyxis sp.]|uniref:adenylate/guanylate cyclase domain-containing protein n=1 Tax=Parasphingopyxis sp. TaxID=1920299 RepID=UPI00263A042A|nr:adenylate/guanylate cyclase domain-containing protein [Parasphingopyxis sp.]
MTMDAAANPLALAREARTNGDFLAAYDIAMTAKAEGLSHPKLDYFAALALADMGETERAAELYASEGLADEPDSDIRALNGRLKKELAQRSPGETQARLFAESSQAYHALYDETHAYFPGVNAATMALLAGQEADARSLAREILAHPEIADPDDYYAFVTAAEAHIILDDGPAALAAMQKISGLSGIQAGQRVSTLRQMHLIQHIVPARQVAIAPLLGLLRPAPVLYYSGHMFVEDEAVEARLAADIAAAFDEIRPEFAYGALACGADIMIAEEALKRGCELNLVFPFDIDDFIAQSVVPGGQGWLDRFHRCREQAKRESFATDSEYIGDPKLFTYGSHIAMGLARMRARHLHTEAVQLAVLQQDSERKAAGTLRDVEKWQSFGQRVRIVDPGAIDRNLHRPPDITVPAEVSRGAYSLIFADFAGFSSLNESVLPLFNLTVLGRMGRVLDAHADKILYRNSWGDALYAVITEPEYAASIALELQQRLGDMPQELLDCAGPNCGMRVGVHHGPIYRAFDAVMQRESFFGTEVTRTARIEPVTPTGEVYVTEAFAAMLAVQSEQPFVCQYVGQVQLAKGYGALAMYKLDRRGDVLEG